MAALKRIQVKGFKSIHEMDLEMRPLNILIGANGSGKSNFLSVFILLSRILNLGLEDYIKRSGGADHLLHYGQKETNAIDINLDYGNSTGYKVHLPSISGDLLSLAGEFYGFGYDNTKAREELMIALMRSVVYHFNDTTKSAKIKKTAHIEDNRFLRSDGANLAPILYLLRERYRPFYDRIIETIQLAAPFFDDFILEPRKLNPDTILLEWHEKGSDTYFSADMLSDGTLRFMCLATLLRQPNPPPLILIDEPELGLHPHAIVILAAMLKSASTKTQIIVTTQSVTLANQFYPEDIIVVDREDKTSTFKRLNSTDIADWIENYAIGELWTQNVDWGHTLMSKRVLILVEGLTEANFVQHLLIPHFQSLEIYIEKPIIIPTNITPGMPYYKGGVAKYTQIRERLHNLLKDTSAVSVTTMFDYYGFPKDFPGWQTIPSGDIYQKVQHLEKIFSGNIQSSRFIPFLTLHEFENLLFTQVDEIATEFSQANKAHTLSEIRAKFPSPEEINDNPNTTASKRLIELFPDYQKDVNGRNIARRIGLAKIRQACKHFNDWLQTLENLTKS